MPKKVISYMDEKGNLHKGLEAATVADLGSIFGSQEGMAPALAKTLLSKREEVERFFAEYDEASKPDTLPEPIVKLAVVQSA